MVLVLYRARNERCVTSPPSIMFCRLQTSSSSVISIIRFKRKLINRITETRTKVYAYFESAGPKSKRLHVLLYCGPISAARTSLDWLTNLMIKSLRSSASSWNCSFCFSSCASSPLIFVAFLPCFLFFPSSALASSNFMATILDGQRTFTATSLSVLE